MEASAQRRQPVRRQIGALIFIVAVIGRSTLSPAPHVQPHQSGAAPVARHAASAARKRAAGRTDAESVRLLVGRSTVVERRHADRARVADERRHRRRARDVAERAAHQRQDCRHDLDVRLGPRRRDSPVRSRRAARPRAARRAQLKELFPERIDRGARATARTSCCPAPSRARTSSRRRSDVAAGYVDKKEDVVTLLQVQARRGRSNQVLLRVRFAEVSRSAMTELGASLFTSPTGIKNTIGRVTTQQFPSPASTTWSTRSRRTPSSAPTSRAHRASSPSATS